MKRHGIIYKITNRINGMVYIGQTVRTLRRRYSNHLSKSSKSYISNAIRKYGKENFDVVELVSCFDQESLNSTEVSL